MYIHGECDQHEAKPFIYSTLRMGSDDGKSEHKETERQNMNMERILNHGLLGTRSPITNGPLITIY